MSAPNAARKDGIALVIPKSPTPAAEGTLGQTPLLHLYVYLLDKSLTGTMVLTPPSGLHVGLFVQDGSPVRAQMRNGVLANDRATQEQALVDLCLLSADTRYAFYSRADFFESVAAAPVHIEPLAAIMSAARACVGSSFASSTLRKVAKASAIKLASNATPERFRLSPEERALIERLRIQGHSLTDLIATSGVPEQVARGVIYGLTITRHLDFGIPGRPPVGVGVLPGPAASTAAPSFNMGAAAPSTPARADTASTGVTTQKGSRARFESVSEVANTPPSSKKPAPSRVPETPSNEKRRADIEAKLAKVANENHFEILGVNENATAHEIRDAYFGMARNYHPDRLADLPDLKPKAQVAFARITAAYNELSDDKRRAAYVAKLKAAQEKPEGKAQAAPNLSNSEEQAAIGRAVNAALEAQKAEVFLKKNELATAEAHAARAAKADPDQPAYTVLLVWIQAQQRSVPTLEEGKSSQVYDDLIATLDQILKKEPDFERAVFYRAVLLQRSGQTDRAFKDFSRALELNPRNIDAAREVRIYKMRAKPDEAQPSTGSGGLFGKLFKR